MPSTQNKLTYPTSCMFIGKNNRYYHQHRAAWLNAIRTPGIPRRIFVKHIENGQPKVYWLNVTVLNEMMKWLKETGGPIRRLKKNERAMLFAKPVNQREPGYKYDPEEE